MEFLQEMHILKVSNKFCVKWFSSLYYASLVLVFDWTVMYSNKIRQDIKKCHWYSNVLRQSSCFCVYGWDSMLILGAKWTDDDVIAGVAALVECYVWSVCMKRGPGQPRILLWEAHAMIHTFILKDFVTRALWHPHCACYLPLALTRVNVTR